MSATVEDGFLARLRAPGTVFPSALAASLFVHLSAMAVLAIAVAGPRATVIGPSPRIDRPLEVVLMVAPSVVESATPTAMVDNMPSAALRVDTVQPTAAAPPDEVAPAPQEPRASPGSATGGFRPRVTVNEKVPRARFGDALEGDTLAGYPIEVDAAVRLPGKLDVPYPRAALERGREDTVLVWVAIDTEGAVEETNVVEGTPEFGDAVKAALAATRFIPAHDAGAMIRFYITLEFEFRVEGPDGAPAADAGASVSR